MALRAPGSRPPWMCPRLPHPYPSSRPPWMCPRLPHPYPMDHRPPMVVASSSLRMEARMPHTTSYMIVAWPWSGLLRNKTPLKKPSPSNWPNLSLSLSSWAIHDLASSSSFIPTAFQFLRRCRALPGWVSSLGLEWTSFWNLRFTSYGPPLVSFISCSPSSIPYTFWGILIAFEAPPVVCLSC